MHLINVCMVVLEVGHWSFWKHLWERQDPPTNNGEQLVVWGLAMKTTFTEARSECQKVTRWWLFGAAGRIGKPTWGGPVGKTYQAPRTPVQKDEVKQPRGFHEGLRPWKFEGVKHGHFKMVSLRLTDYFRTQDSGHTKWGNEKSNPVRWKQRGSPF